MSELSVMPDASAGDVQRLSVNICGRYLLHSQPAPHCEIGVLKGEGIGPEIIDATLSVLSAVQSFSDATFSIHHGGAIGVESTRVTGTPLNGEVILFCETIFSRGGAVISGPGGGRYVYDLRKQFDLFCKLNPLTPHVELRQAGRLKSEWMEGVDLLVVRENTAGIYQGEWGTDVLRWSKSGLPPFFLFDGPREPDRRNCGEDCRSATGKVSGRGQIPWDSQRQ